MTYNEYFASLVNYWGEYDRTGIAMDTEAFVRSRIAERYLSALLNRLQIDIPAHYSTPSISETLKAFKALEKEKALDRIDNKILIDADRRAITYTTIDYSAELRELIDNLKKGCNVSQKYEKQND